MSFQQKFHAFIRYRLLPFGFPVQLNQLRQKHQYYKMFSRFLRPFWNKIRSPRTLLTATAIFSYSLYRNRILLDSPNNEPTLSQDQIKSRKFGEYVKQLQNIDVCEGKELLENQRKIVKVKDISGVQRKIMIIRIQGKLYAFNASCPHQQPFQPSDADWSLEKAVVFHDKLYCPHHGCIFDIKSGSIEHGPAVNNLPIFFAQQVNGMVQLLYPAAIPTSIAPNATEKDVEDLRKAVILGDDDAATIGCINSLRQFGYQGEITVAREGNYEYPYRKEYLHKKLLNVHLQQPETMKKVEENQKKRLQNQKKPKKRQLTLQQKLNRYIDQQLQDKIYSKLQYFDEKWYKHFGVDFVFNDQPYRIINKQYYPYITFADGTKLQYDALMIATGIVPKIPTFEGITTDDQKDTQINLPENVFCPLRSKEQHKKLNKFLNNNTIKSLLVLGYNVQSLQFVQALKQEFPQIKVTVIDNEPNSSLSQFVGPDLQKAIAKQFTSRGVQFYIKVRDQLLFSNKFSKNNIERIKEEEQLKKLENRVLQEDKKQDKNKSKGKSNDKNKTVVKPQNAVVEPKLKYNDAVTVRLADGLRIKADGVVLFPNTFSGNSEWVRNGKYTDFDYYHNDRLGGDTFCRTESIRIFSAGLSSANEYFLMAKRLVTFDPTTSYEQGFNVGLNMQALRIPFTYVPYQKFQFFDKKFFYVGTRDYFDSVLIMGSLENWDFLAVYGLGSSVKGVSGSPSRARQLSIIREALRVNCMPSFDDLVSGYWTIQNLSKLIRKLNKSGCYRDLIFQNRENIHMKDLLWMQRTADAGFENDRPQNTQDRPSVQVGADGKLKDL